MSIPEKIPNRSIGEASPPNSAADRLRPQPLRVLFLCTRNSARSQIAEAVLSRKGGQNFIVASAGSNPGAEVHPMAVEALREFGVDWRGKTAKGCDVVSNHDWDLVITVCDKARESCPTMPGRPVYAHWGIPDPAAVEGTETERRRAFHDAVRFLSRRIDLLLSLPFEKLQSAALKERVDRIATVIASPGEGDDAGGQSARRIALISDIHANLPALESVLHDIADQRSISATYHLGDLVGYATWPNEVVSLLRGFHITGVSGNYDSTVATDYKHCGCKYEDPRQEELSHVSYAWTRQHVNPETKRFLGELPFRLDVRPLGGHTAGPTLILIHGTPALNTLYWTEDRPDSFCSRMAEIAGAKTGDVIAFGHTHKPWHRVVEGIHFVNTGSVGRPKDGDWRAGYVILDFEVPQEVQVTFRRVEYDVARAALAIERSELPNEFADYLRAGGSETPTSEAPNSAIVAPSGH